MRGPHDAAVRNSIRDGRKRIIQATSNSVLQASVTIASSTSLNWLYRRSSRRRLRFQQKVLDFGLLCPHWKATRVAEIVSVGKAINTLLDRFAPLDCCLWSTLCFWFAVSPFCALTSSLWLCLAFVIVVLVVSLGFLFSPPEIPSSIKEWTTALGEGALARSCGRPLSPPLSTQTRRRMSNIKPLAVPYILIYTDEAVVAAALAVRAAAQTNVEARSDDGDSLYTDLHSRVLTLFVSIEAS